MAIVFIVGAISRGVDISTELTSNEFTISCQGREPGVTSCTVSSDAEECDDSWLPGSDWHYGSVTCARGKVNFWFLQDFFR